jgi:serine/threonine protein kinase
MMTLVKVGDVLAGKYHVDRILGIGGMGIVIAATHRELDQRVALKFMLPDALANEAATERFLREAKAAVKLRSEHICRVLDTGRLDSGGPYIVMEFLEGEDLAQVIKRRGRIPLGELVDLILQAIEGVAEAHANRIVHRDLKPGNLFVTTDNDGSPLVKVLDFGISKSALGGSATKTGDMMGSPAYMAPEQMMSSKDVDARADVWALGVILYQAATAALPFEADTLPALCMAVMGHTPPLPNHLRAELPAKFATVVMRCLEKQPEARFADVAALAAALVPFGSPDAVASATRIGKVLRRAKTTAPPPIEVAPRRGSR